jgi:hypothetical protein
LEEIVLAYLREGSPHRDGRNADESENGAR